MIVFPNAKINIGLNIVSKRNDGYHNLETIFYPIEICDALEIIYNPHAILNKDQLIIEGLEIASEKDNNLVLNAVNLLRNNGFEFPKLDIHLLKKIPMGAGIGGGSSDATNTLIAINNIFKLNISKSDLAKFASQLGADCAFFIDKQPKYAEGIGDILEDIELDLTKYYIYLVKPDTFISTQEAFSNIVPHPSNFPLKDSIKKPIKEWRNYINNDFELSIFPKYPHLQSIKDKLYSLGADYVSMTGSGASIYAICSHPLPDFDKYFYNCYLWCNKIMI